MVGNGGTSVINPVYDAQQHIVTWDFTTIQPELGLPDGSSGTVEIEVKIAEGVLPDGVSISNRAVIPTSNAGTATGDSNTTISGVSPKWTLTKSVTSGPIYHDRPVTYEIEVCPDTRLGNLHLTDVTISDVLPLGATFVSASGGGVFDGNQEITWTFMDTFFVSDPCRFYEVVVVYPESDPNNQTGLATEITKVNTATLDATAVDNTPVQLTDTAEDALLPPVFQTGIGKETGNGNGATPVGTTNKFILNLRNESTTSIDDLIVRDTLPPQVDVTHIHIEPTMGDTVLANIRVQLDNDPQWVNFQLNVNTANESEFAVADLPGWMAGTSYINAVEVDYGTVKSNFKGAVELIFEPSYPTANDGSTTNLDTPYSNEMTVTYVRPLDGMIFEDIAATPFCVVDSGAARIDPAQEVAINYVNPPAGDPTTGNPFFKGSRVKYTLSIGNDGMNDSDEDPEITADGSFVIVTDPIGSNLLPPQMEYETGSWTITNNTSDETWDNSGTNPTFEIINDFNNTGKSLLRWTFDGMLDPGEGLDICFNATIRDTVETGRVVENGFAMSAQNDLYCDAGDCEPPATNPNLNDYFVQTSNPSLLISGI
ncbi:MAG: hypothetical protein AB8G22_20555, partial [Saprospiraceae bacterium]